MNEVFVLYSLIYTIITFCFVYKTDLFISVGLTVENLFDSYLGREHDNFIMYHIKKTCITKILHLSIPLGFFTGLSIFKAQKYFVLLLGEISWQLILLGSLSIPVYALFELIFQYQQDWSTHHIVKKLKLFQNDRMTSWKAVSHSINEEYKLSDKTILHCGNRMKLVLTRNWIVKVGTYDLDLAHQNDARLIVCSADTHDTGSNGYSTVVQFINVKIIYSNDTRDFLVRLHAFDFKDLKEAVHCPITVSENVTFYQTKVEEFLEIFKDLVKNNPTFEFTGEEIEMCIGCMTSEANVKLVKHCNDISTNEPVNGAPEPKCVSCKCRPLWCIDCMGKWFASRQDQTLTETWLSSKCPCPVCRSTFCMLDVCPVIKPDRN
ncbi:E3 ubiquitin-protein ligase TM129 [Planococcus citri]|uniref:E3 ubiquitin-protein ligase TM129 n=1 Tax=Planococcus citri TaxID=170843 RepID=UPI0031F9324F